MPCPARLLTDFHKLQAACGNRGGQSPLWNPRKAAPDKLSEGKCSVELHQFWSPVCEQAALD